MTYRQMIERIAALLGRRPRIVEVPVLTPALSALWLELVTPVNASVARPLVEGLRNPTSRARSGCGRCSRSSSRRSTRPRGGRWRTEQPPSASRRGSRRSPRPSRRPAAAGRARRAGRGRAGSGRGRRSPCRRGTGVRRWVCSQRRNGPRRCTSVKPRGGSQSTISVRQRIGTPKSRSRYRSRAPAAEPGRRLDDPEAQPRRRDPLEVVSVGEEGERLLERHRDDLRPLEHVLPAHAAAASRAQAASRPR